MNWQILSLFYIVVTIYKSGIFGSPIDSETWVQSYKKTIHRGIKKIAALRQLPFYEKNNTNSTINRVFL